MSVGVEVQRFRMRVKSSFYTPEYVCQITRRNTPKTVENVFVWLSENDFQKYARQITRRHKLES
jgi:hypothetical protein